MLKIKETILQKLFNLFIWLIINLDELKKLKAKGNLRVKILTINALMKYEFGLF